MKKKLIVLLFIVICLSGTFGLTACGGSTKYVCETEGFTDEYIILMNNTLYEFYKNGETEEGSYGFKGADNIMFKPHDPSLTGAEISEMVKEGLVDIGAKEIGQYAGTIINDVITIEGKVYKKA